MKDEIMNRLAAVLNALNAVSVNGKQNLVNLSGSIAVIEEVAAMLGEASIEKASAADGEKKK